MTRWYAGYGTSLMTEALIHHRDAIVGNWKGGFANADLNPLDDAKNLKRWEPWVRASILDFELMMPLHFAVPVDEKDKEIPDTFMLWHVDPVAGKVPGFIPIASLSRPLEAKLLKQLDLVEGYAALREDRASEILAQLGPAAAFWSAVVNLHPDRTRWTLELIDIALRLANFVEMRFKQALSCRRPVEFSPQVQPMILTPGHGTLPSGHATESFMIAYILWQLMRDKGRDALWCEMLMRQANRVAVNRTIAGVHFPIDSAAGEMLGLTLGQYFVTRALAKDKYESCRFFGNVFADAADFQWRLLFDTTSAVPKRAFPAAAPKFAEKIGDEEVPQSKLLAKIWELAAEEWL